MRINLKRTLLCAPVSCYVIFVVVVLFVIHVHIYNANLDADVIASPKFLVPNIIHYVIFEQCFVSFITYLSILSAIKVQKPSKIVIATDCSQFTGEYWAQLENNSSNVPIERVYVQQPTHVYGQRLSSVYHVSDVVRIQMLQEFGGIYLDTDTVVINNLDQFRHYEMVVGWPLDEPMGNQILLAQKNARFLGKWMEGYKHYKPRSWYYNAGEYPTESILKQKPMLAFRVPTLFGVHNLLEELHSDISWSWGHYFTIHLLARHRPPTPADMSERAVKRMRTNFGDIARWLLQL